MKIFSLICFIDTPALNLCGSEDFRESLMNEKELAPFDFIGDSCFTAFCANRVVLFGSSLNFDSFRSLVQVNTVLGIRKPRGQILFFMGLFLLFTFF